MHDARKSQEKILRARATSDKKIQPRRIELLPHPWQGCMIPFHHSCDVHEENDTNIYCTLQFMGHTRAADGRCPTERSSFFIDCVDLLHLTMAPLEIPHDLIGQSSLYNHPDPLLRRLRLDDSSGGSITDLDRAFKGKEVVVLYAGSEHGSSASSGIH
jgi:hypothetical protein